MAILKNNIKIFCILLFVATLFGCEKSPQNAILGKWHNTYYGTMEDDLVYNYAGETEYYEFKSDGTVWFYQPSNVDINNQYRKVWKYKIDKKYFYRYDTDGENEGIFNYSFDGNKFKISNIDPKFPGNLDIYIVNVCVYERYNN